MCFKNEELIEIPTKIIIFVLMKLRNQFILLAMLLVAAGVMLIVISTGLDKRVLYAAEGFLALCVGFVVYFFHKVIKTLNALANGMDLLNEQDFSSRLARVGQYDADRIVEVFNRMMAQLKSERLRLREQNGFLDLIIQSSPMGVIILDFDSNVMSVNESALQFMGYQSQSDMLGHNLESLTSPLAERLKLVKQGNSETLRLGDAMIYRCSRLSFIDRGAQHPCILIESLTSEVMKAEKKAYEKVIRMIAHEVNNSVAGVTSTLDTIQDAMSCDDDSADMRDAMTVCIERCYGLSRFITRFADVVKIPEPELVKVDLNECVMSAKAFMESVCSEREITLQLNVNDGEVEVNIDSALIEQVLVNVIKNAAESINHGGQITITTASNPQKTIVITDDGAGISDEVADKLFTPFFSTKPNGEGLGLIFIREVLLKHNCAFSLRTYDDGLTRFKITFP